MPILIAGVLACRPSQPVAPDPTETVPPVGACDADPALFLEVTPSEGVVSNHSPEHC